MTHGKQNQKSTLEVSLLLLWAAVIFAVVVGVGVAYFTTNSTGKLAFLNNMIAVIEDEIQPNGDTLITAWEWRWEE